MPAKSRQGAKEGKINESSSSIMFIFKLCIPLRLGSLARAFTFFRR
jgi:hypothetical protein